MKNRVEVDIRVKKIPQLLLTNTDSEIDFTICIITGNKFEFRVLVRQQNMRPTAID